MNPHKKRKELTEKQKMRYLSDKYPSLKQLITKLDLVPITDKDNYYNDK